MRIRQKKLIIAGGKISKILIGLLDDEELYQGYSKNMKKNEETNCYYYKLFKNKYFN